MFGKFKQSRGGGERSLESVCDIFYIFKASIEYGAHA